MEDMTWSYSRVSGFSECQYKWFLRYIRKLPEQPRFYASYGSFMHRLLAAYYKGEASRVEQLIKFLFGFQKEVCGPRPQESTVSKFIHAGSEYLRRLQPSPFEPIAVEQKVDFNIGDYDFVGFIDLIGKRDGDLYIIDHKSRELKPRSGRKQPTKLDLELEEKLRQLYLYAEAVFQLYGSYPKALIFNCFKSGVVIEEPFSEAACREAKQWAETEIGKLMEESEFPPQREYFRCRWLCGHNEDCCYWTGRGGDT